MVKLPRQFIYGSLAWICATSIVLVNFAGDERAIASSTHPLITAAQLPSFAVPNSTPVLPSEVERRGTLESARIYLDGKELFRIASPVVLDRSNPGDLIPVEIRAKQIEANLQQTVSSYRSNETLDRNTLQVIVETINEQPVLFVRDRTQAETKVLLTVTDADAQYASTSKERLAQQWRETLEQALRLALELRKPGALKQQTAVATQVLMATLGLSLLFGAIWTKLRHRRKHLEQRQATEIAAAPATASIATELDEPRSWLVQELQQYLGWQRRIQFVRVLQWISFWAIAFIWMVGIAYSLSLFPQTQQFARKVITIPIFVLLTWFFAGLINRVTDLLIDRFIQNRKQDQSLTESNLQRITTVASFLKGLKLFLIYATGLLWLLQSLNLVPGSVLILGTLIALAISFAAQSLVKDFVNGLLILLEDQYRIGDMVRIGTVAGRVENLNLRITQIRSDEGDLITLPNNLITQVENRTRLWARADVRIEVAYQTNVDRALAIVRETIDRMARDPHWQTIILDTHEVFGVEQISHAGIMIRVWIKTMPMKQWDTARELRRRLKNAFDDRHIQIGIPQQIWIDNGLVQSDRIEADRMSESERHP
ncbi:MAG: mechanosensitive ion channel family protein [Cyanosarcina radialis HA8281-LM2]|jgi:small conductance mechanosensitive channel|nr:mechanosensitive ion channel family protein [Cyanosarcina radialis HA8281-LM2]